jgi:putative FmdB family regulatory protein
MAGLPVRRAFLPRAAPSLPFPKGAEEGDSMPDYEFVCQRCRKIFTNHMSVQEHEDRTPECPQCRSSQEVHRAISHFNVQTSRKSASM